MNRKNTRRGFTLIELLVVVLIIGVLAAIALPMYQKAVLKSRFSAMMPIAKAMAESNEEYYLEHGSYSEDPEELLVQGKDTTQEAYPDGTSILMYSNPEDLSFVRTENSSIPNVRYVVTQKHSKNFPDTAWCEASDEAGEELCVSFGGVIPDGVSGNSGMDADWTAYLLSGEAKEGDGFGNNAEETSNNEIPCNEDEKPGDKVYDANGVSVRGEAVCSRGQWKYVWSGGQTFEERNASCSPESGLCMGATFSGLRSYCSLPTRNTSDYRYSCAGSTFSGTASTCYGNSVPSSSKACIDSTFSGAASECSASFAGACSGSVFSGLGSRCVSSYSEGCKGAIIQGGAYCEAYVAGACDGAIYEETVDANGNTKKGCCYSQGGEGHCSPGSPKCVVKNNVSTYWFQYLEVETEGEW